jgi:hypothetical protein
MRCAITGLRFMLCGHTNSTRFVSFRTKVLCKSAKPECKPKAMEPFGRQSLAVPALVQKLSGVARSLTLRSRGGPTACHQAWATGCSCPFSVAQARRHTVGLPLSSNVRHHAKPTAHIRMGYRPAASLKNESHAFLVQDYRRKCQCHYRYELDFFASQPDLRRSIAAAAASKGFDGKRLTHQRRLFKRVIPEASVKLLRLWPLLRRANNFHHLHRLVENRIKLIHGVGPLFIYDVALRIGAHLELLPNRIYLHRGSYDGAKEIRMPPASSIISRHWPPVPYARLLPHEVENLFCIYACVLKP